MLVDYNYSLYISLSHSWSLLHKFYWLIVSVMSFLFFLLVCKYSSFDCVKINNVNMFLTTLHFIKKEYYVRTVSHIVRVNKLSLWTNNSEIKRVRMQIGGFLWRRSSKLDRTIVMVQDDDGLYYGHFVKCLLWGNYYFVLYGSYNFSVLTGISFKSIARSLEICWIVAWSSFRQLIGDYLQISW